MWSLGHPFRAAGGACAVLSWFPRIVVYPAFVDEARCNHIIKIANASMYPSGLAFRSVRCGALLQAGGRRAPRPVAPVDTSRRAHPCTRRPGEKVDENQQTRTSKGTFMSAHQDPDGVLAWVEQRIAAVTRIPVDHGEAFNILQYQHLAKYSSHMDSFDPKVSLAG